MLLAPQSPQSREASIGMSSREVGRASSPPDLLTRLLVLRQNPSFQLRSLSRAKTADDVGRAPQSCLFLPVVTTLPPTEEGSPEVFISQLRSRTGSHPAQFRTACEAWQAGACGQTPGLQLPSAWVAAGWPRPVEQRILTRCHASRVSSSVFGWPQLVWQRYLKTGRGWFSPLSKQEEETGQGSAEHTWQCLAPRR